MARRNNINWAAIEADYRVGQLTVRMLASKHGVAPSSITRRAKRNAWRKGDLKVFVRQLTRAMLNADRIEEARISNRIKEYTAREPGREI